MSQLLKFMFLMGLIIFILMGLPFSQEKTVTKTDQTEEKKTKIPTNVLLLAPLAETEKVGWTNDRMSIYFPGKDDDPLGSAYYRENVELEDKTVYSKVLVTHPEMKEKKGMIVGIFHLGKLPENAIFKTKVGFLKEASQTDGVKARVFSPHDPLYKAEKICHYDGTLDELILPLDRFAGKDIDIALKVFVLDSYHQDWVAWIDPRIEW